MINLKVAIWWSIWKLLLDDQFERCYLVINMKVAIWRSIWKLLFDDQYKSCYLIVLGYLDIHTLLLNLKPWSPETGWQRDQQDKDGSEEVEVFDLCSGAFQPGIIIIIIIELLSSSSNNHLLHPHHVFHLQQQIPWLCRGSIREWRLREVQLWTSENMLQLQLPGIYQYFKTFGNWLTKFCNVQKELEYQFK